MRAARTDVTQREIVAVLRGIGWRVWICGPQSAIDLAVLVGRDVYLVDCKRDAKAPRTVTQQGMIDDGWPIVFATSGQDAIDQIAAMRRRGTP